VRIVVAVDAFKGCMTSLEAGTIIADGLRRSGPEAEVVVLPVADGGEGTTTALLLALGGTRRTVRVTGPLGDEVAAVYGVLADRRTAVMEMASASGIELVPPGRLDPMAATTYGTGELIRAAIGDGAREIVLGIGGSATVDGGIGMAQALGYRLCTADGAECGRGGGALEKITRIETGAVLPTLASCRLRVACDVSNPLLGERGAARVFAGQKGAGPAEVEALERGLDSLARVWLRQGFLDDVDRPGDGAAGGLGAGLRAFCSAEIVSGADLIADLVGFDDAIRGAAVLITGEGRTDHQTAAGKLPAVLARRARAAGVRTVLLSGAITGDLPELDGLFDARFATVDADAPPSEAIRRGRENLEAIATEVARSLAGPRRQG
jgi:glycerate kinase